jgi:hypothetical protein
VRFGGVKLAHLAHETENLFLIAGRDGLGHELNAIVIVAMAPSSSVAGETLICCWVAMVNSDRASSR